MEILAQLAGRSAGLTPQETALVTVSLTMGKSFPLEVEPAIAGWRTRGKIDTEKPEVRDALADMGFDVMPVTATFFNTPTDLLDDDEVGYATSTIGRLFAERRWAGIDNAENRPQK